MTSRSTVTHWARLSVLDRYLMRGVLLAWLATILVLVGILMSIRLGQYLTRAVAGELPVDLVFPMLGYKTLAYMAMMLPMSLYLGQLLTLGRLYKDSEIAAMFGCGVSVAQIYRGLFLLGIPVFALTMAFSVWISPWAAAQGEALKAIAQSDTHISGIAAGQFRENTDGDRVFYAESIDEDGERLRKVFVHGYREGRPALAAAAGARLEVDEPSGDRYFVLEDGWRYDNKPDSDKFKIIRFGAHGIFMDDDIHDPQSAKREAIPTVELFGDPNVHHRSELHWRLTTPFLILVLSLLVLPVGRLAPRQGRYSRMVYGILVFILYLNLLSIFRTQLEKGVIPWEMGLWWLHAVTLVLAIFLLTRMLGGRWMAVIVAQTPLVGPYIARLFHREAT